MTLVNDEQTCSIISLVFYTYLDPVIFLGARVPHLSYDQLPPLSDTDYAKHLTGNAFPVRHWAYFIAFNWCSSTMTLASGSISGSKKASFILRFDAGLSLVPQNSSLKQHGIIFEYRQRVFHSMLYDYLPRSYLISVPDCTQPAFEVGGFRHLCRRRV